MRALDITILVTYIIGLLFMGYKLSKKNETQEDYFVASRSMPWVPIALSIAATTISANGFISGPGWAYKSGLSAFMLNISIPFVLFLACSIFIPFLYNLKITSCYEYLELRFGIKTQLIGSIGFLGTALIQVSSMIYIPSLIISQITGMNIIYIVPIIVIVSVIYTLLGGIRAVIWTDTVQMLILWGGLLSVVVVALESIDVSFFTALGTAKVAGKLNAFIIPSNFSTENDILVTLIGGSILWLQYYVTDQSQVQRMFTAKSVNEVKKSLVISGLLMNVMYFIFMLVGLVMFSFYGGKEFNDSNLVMIEFITNKIPVGFVGLIIASVFAAAMSSVDSILNSMSAVFIKNIYEKIPSNKRKETSLGVSMAFTSMVAILLIVVTIIGFVGSTNSILAVVGGYISYLCGSVLAVFLLGMFTQKCNDWGASIGFIAGVFVTAYVGQTTNINWLYYNVIGLTVSYVVGYLVSIIISRNKLINKSSYTIIEQRKKIIQTIKSNPEQIINIPGRFDKYSLILLLFFFIQYIFLYVINI